MIGRIRRKLYFFGKSLNRKSIISGISSDERQLISSIRSQNLTYLSENRLASLAKTCRSIEETNLPGIFLEAGCALGGSAILLASIKKTERPLWLYDVFGQIPPPTAEDLKIIHNRYKIISEGKADGIGGEKYYGISDDLYEVVIANLERNGISYKELSISLIKGLVQDTMKIDQPVAFAHIDVDWYEPVKVCFTRVFPNLVVGGSIIVDDYHYWDGCKKATDEYLREVHGKFITDDTTESLKITKLKD